MLNDTQKDILRQNISSSLLKYDMINVMKILDRYPSFVLDTNYKIEDSNYQFILPKNGLSLLHIAAYADFLEAFIYLLNQKVPLNILSHNSFLPLHYALSRNSLEIVCYIISKDPGIVRNEDNIRNVNHSLLYYAIESNNIRIVRSLFDNGYSVHSQINSNDFPAILNLIAIKRPSLLQCVIDNSGNSINPFTRANNKLSLVMLSIISNNSEIVQALIENGLDEDLNSTSFDGNCAFFYACFKKVKNAATIILENMKRVEDKVIFKNSICYSLCRLCSPSLVNYILFSGEYNVFSDPKENIASKDRGINILKLNLNKEPPLFGLLTDDNLRKENLKKVFKIISSFMKCGYPIDFQPAGKNTLLAEACLGLFKDGKKPMELIEFLLQNGANPMAEVAVKKMPLFDYLVKMAATRERKAELQPLIEIFEKYVNKQ